VDDFWVGYIYDVTHTTKLAQHSVILV
jgi:hypothetical protein